MSREMDCVNLLGCEAPVHMDTCPGPLRDHVAMPPPARPPCIEDVACEAQHHRFRCPKAAFVRPIPADVEEKPILRWNGAGGIWVVWEMGNEGEDAHTIHSHQVRAIESLARLGHGSIAFWRFDMTLKDSIAWYAAEIARMDAAEAQLTER